MGSPPPLCNPHQALPVLVGVGVPLVGGQGPGTCRQAPCISQQVRRICWGQVWGRHAVGSQPHDHMKEVRNLNLNTGLLLLLSGPTFAIVLLPREKETGKGHARAIHQPDSFVLFKPLL